MYVRNYNSSQAQQHSATSAKNSEVTTDTTENISETTEVTPDNLSASENISTETGILELLPRDPTQNDSSLDKEASSDTLSDIQEEHSEANISERDFGQNGLPRQPLRRHRLRIPTSEAELSLPQPTEHKPELPHQSSNIPNTDKDIFEARADIDVSDSPCSCDESVTKPTQNAVNLGISTEDLLLGALLLLLINDHTDDGILLILGFIFITGFSAAF